MRRVTTTFFEELGARASDPLAARARGTIRFDLTSGRKVESWRLRVDRGEIDVSRGAGKADCVITVSQDAFDELAAGKANPLAAQLRGILSVEGDMRLAVLFQRLLPGPPKSRRRR